MKADKVEKPTKRRPLSRRISKQRESADAAAQQQKDTNTDFSDTDLFEIEESESPLIPLYQIREEGAMKWVLFTDLCYLLKIKSKDTLLKLVSFGGKRRADRYGHMMNLFVLDIYTFLVYLNSYIRDPVPMHRYINAKCYVN